MSECIIETQMHFTMLESPHVVPNLRLSKANRLNKVSFAKGNGVVRKKEIDGFMVFVDWMYIIICLTQPMGLEPTTLFSSLLLQVEEVPF